MISALGHTEKLQNVTAITEAPRRFVITVTYQTCEQIHGQLALEYQEAAMTTQFSGKASLPPAGSALVRRLVRARNDPGKDRIRMWLIDVDDTQLRSRLGLTQEDIAVLRGAIH